jgi:hypothetical protein
MVAITDEEERLEREKTDTSPRDQESLAQALAQSIVLNVHSAHIMLII